ncbi:hypothetical protein H310_15047 [Aphanomyces invadans]|uniref:Uncharacterized protein n=1 Tax=Aphanomyces invadans TaxID=157072 RepID=A0A024T863_9STRA|nr:hypothetical protein H310_15047 [Aphanomyces invadans]ETV90119.1 hypothetical protein H310_15047 [Aphanomyces invadans]|eukprot:XP_008881247.1 hypothetical protein H310_15047 [Aphanomyces invadans]
MDRSKAIRAETKKEGKLGKAVTIAKEVNTVGPNETTAVPYAARIVCTANEVVEIGASFDSVEDQSVIPPKTLKRLQDVTWSGVEKKVMLATMHELVDDLVDEEEALVPMELAECLPDMTPVDRAVEQAKVQTTLDAKAAGAMAASCGH